MRASMKTPMTRRRKLAIALAGALGGILALGLLAFMLPHQVLCVDSGETHGDVMVVLGGGGPDRPTRAAELFRASAAPKIIVSGNGDCESSQQILVWAGVPKDAIRLECDSRNTKENAQYSIPLLRAAGAKRVIIVTSWYHSRRALCCFQHYAPEIQFYSRPTYAAYNRDQWSNGRVSNRIRLEYVKLAGYWVRYGIMPI